MNKTIFGSIQGMRFSVVLMLAVLVGVFACMVPNVALADEEGSTSSDDYQISVEVPTEVPCHLMADGTVLTPENWTIQNQSKFPVRLSNVTVNASDHYPQGLTVSATTSDDGYTLWQYNGTKVDFNPGYDFWFSDVVKWNIPKLTRENAGAFLDDVSKGTATLMNVSLTFQGNLPEPTVAISGDTWVDAPITASIKDVPDGVAAYYQWQTTTDGKNYTDISGANGSTYYPTSNEKGKHIRCHVSFDKKGDYLIPDAWSNVLGPINATAVSFAIYTKKTNNYGAASTLKFYKRPAESIPQVGDTFEGDKVDAIFRDFEYHDAYDKPEDVPWYNYTNSKKRLDRVSVVEFVDKGIRPQNIKNWFAFDMDYIDRWYYIDSIDASNLDTSQTKDMSYAFYGCCFMRDWEFHQNFDTSSATNMAYMFYGCDGFREVDFSNFRTSNVKTMAHMFDGSSLHRIDMSQWDISNVTDMSWMFSNDTGLSFVKGPKRVSGKTDGVDMSRMFSGCDQALRLDFSQFDNRGSTTKMDHMFDGVSGRYSFGEVKLGENFGWYGDDADETSRLPRPDKDASRMMDGYWHAASNGAQYLPNEIPSFTADTYYSAGVPFAVYSEDDHSLEFYTRVASEVPEEGSIFNGKKVTALYRGFTTDWYRSADAVPWAEHAADIEHVSITENEIFPGSTAYWFTDLKNMTSCDLSNLNTTNVFDMSYMFCGCSSLKNLDVGLFNTNQVSNMRRMFNGCSSLTSIDGLNNFSTANVTLMDYMFNGCTAVSSLDLSSFDTSRVTDMTGMFSWCPSLTSLDLSSFDTSKVTYMMSMFDFCTKLESLDVSSFNTSNVTFMKNMFRKCESLRALDLSGFDTSKVVHAENMFQLCDSLMEVTFGKSFSWVGNYCYLPTPSDEYVEKADGYWYADSDGEKYKPEAIPAKKADTYYAADYQAFAVYFDNGSLNFYKRNVAPQVGDQFDGAKVVAVYTDVEGDPSSVSTYSDDGAYKAPWYEHHDDITSVNVVDKRIKPVSIMKWFSDCSKLSYCDLTNLDMSKCVNADDLFSGCSSMWKIELGDKVGKVDLPIPDDHHIDGADGKWYVSTDKGNKEGLAHDAIPANTQATYYAYPSKAFAMYSDDDTSLDFYRDFELPNTGDVYSGKRVTDLYAGVETSSYASADAVPWANHASDVTNVYITENGLHPTSMAHWFAGFTGMETFEFPYLDVSRVTDFSHMLDGCSSLKTLNITNFTTLPNETRQQTPAMTSMFDGCVALTQVMVGDTFAFAEDGLLPAPDGEHVSGADGKWYAMSTGEGYDPKDIPSYKAETYRADHGDFQAFAVYSAASDGEPAILNFYKRPVVPAEGTVFDGRVATKVFTGFENRTYSVADDLWESYKNSYIYSSVTKATVVDYGIAPLNLSHWFHKFWSLESVDVSKLDVSRAKEMVEMFHECGNLTSIDLSTFQTSSVTDMESMFASCYKLKSVSFPESFDTLNVTNMSRLFVNCYDLESLDLSHFNTKKVTASQDTFTNITCLATVKIGPEFKWLENGVGASFLPTPASGKWHAKWGPNEYEGDYAPEELWKIQADAAMLTASPVDFAVYFAPGPYDQYPGTLEFYHRTTLPEPDWYINDRKITAVYANIDNTSTDGTNIPWAGVASNIKNVTTVDAIAPTSTAGWFSDFTQMNSCDISKLDTSNVTSMTYMFYKCEGMATIQFPETFNTSKVESMSGMFSLCGALTSIDLKGFDTSHVARMSYMFQGCTALTSLDISNFDASSLQYAYWMFEDCDHLSSVTIGSKWRWMSDQNAYLPVTDSHPKWYASDGTGYLPKDVPIPTTGTATYTQNPPAQVAAQDANNPAVASDPSASTASVPQGTQAAAASPNKSAAGSSQSAEGAASSGTQGNDASSMPAARKEQAVVEGSASEEGAPSADTQSSAAGGKPVNDHAE